MRRIGIRFRFWSRDRISLLVQFEQMKVDQKRNFKRFINHVIMNGSIPAHGPLSFVRTGTIQFYGGPKAKLEQVVNHVITTMIPQ